MSWQLILPADYIFWHIVCGHKLTGQEMEIREIMTRDVEVISRDADVRSAAIKMRDLNIGVIPVCDGPVFAGILTDRDIAVRLAAAGHDATRTLVGEIMTRDLTYCFEDQNIEDAVAGMEFHRINRLPILDRNHQLVGIVAMSDIAAHLEARAGNAAALADVSVPGNIPAQAAVARR
jgi:CBS domain-containing protein